jgi:hypothetical protein
MSSEGLASILAKKKDISEGSAKTYAASLLALWRKVGLTSPITATGVKKQFSKLVKGLKDMKPKPRKVTASAMLLLLENNKDTDTIKSLITDANKEDNTEEEKQELTPAQKAAWMDWKDILRVRERLEEEAEPLFSKLNLSSAEVQKLQDYVIVCLFTYNPPRRLLDYCWMRNGEPQNKNENGVKRSGKAGSPGTFVFNRYKTAKKYGTQTIAIPAPLWRILREWMTINPCPWLIADINCKQMTPNGLRKRMSRIFGKPGLGVNILRHAYVSDVVLPDMPFLDKLKKTAEQLGHSPEETLLYKKRKT